MSDEIFKDGFCQWLRENQTDEDRKKDQEFFGTTRILGIKTKY